MLLPYVSVEEQGVHSIENQNKGCERSSMTADLGTTIIRCGRIVWENSGVKTRAFNSRMQLIPVA